MESFIYDTPTRVYFGRDQEKKVGEIVATYGAKKVLIHYGGGSAVRSGLIGLVEKSLGEQGIGYVLLGGVMPNPEIGMVREGIELCRREEVDFILAVGGGSVLDSAKDIANGVANPEVDVWDFTMGVAKPLKTLKKGCILTIAAAGSEMSDSCVISDSASGIKRGYGSPCNRMNFAIENPELTYSVDAYQTACGAVDIAMHTMERYFCPGEDTYLTDAIAEAVMKSAIRSGADAIRDPKDYTARANMMWASSLAHNGLTACGRKTQLVVHQLEHELSAMYPKIAHGAGLAALWCSWARYVCDANRARFLQWAQNVWDLEVDFEHPERTCLKAIDLQEQYYRSIGMPTRIGELDVKETDLETLSLRCSRDKSRSLIGRKPLAYEDILAIYRMAL